MFGVNASFRPSTIRSLFKAHTIRKRPRSWSSTFATSSFAMNAVQDKEGLRIAKNIRSTPVVPIDSKDVYKYLNLETFTDAEIKSVFHEIQHKQREDKSNVSIEGTTTDHISPRDLNLFIERSISRLEKENGYSHRTYDDNISSADTLSTIQLMQQKFVADETQRCWDFLILHIPDSKSKSVSLLTDDDFCAAVKNSASSLDTKRMLPLTMSMVLVGASVGVVTPAMPFVVQNLGLTAGEYGLVVSAFALSKMAGNIPSAVLVERHGRKPYLVYSMAAIALGVGGIGFATSFEHLYLCRLATGMGVASLSAAVTMTVTDISTPLNRASSFAPVMSAFSAGTALGPALGGILCDQIGINPTFYIVGVSYFGLAAVNNVLLSETQPKPMTFPWQKLPESKERQPSIGESFQAALGQWVPLMSMPPVRNVCIMNCFYWMGLAGSQMTLLPLILTNADGLAMSATSVGQVYMGMSLVQVLGNPILANVIDRVGKVPGIVGGCTLISLGMASLPFCSNYYEMAGVLAVWATGSSLLSTSPISYISDKVDDKRRAQAIALLRTSGDVGFLVGASSMGALADKLGSLEVAMQSSSGILLMATGWFALRNILSARLQNDEARTR